MRRTTECNSDKYGDFLITEEENGKSSIWWDFLCEHEGMSLEPGCDVWWDDCDIKDFSDMPKDGVFENFQEAFDYVTNKFGKLK